jgi:hypothetical protein
MKYLEKAIDEDCGYLIPTWEYISGYIDGEGSLTFGVVQDKRKNWKSKIDYYQCTPTLSISSCDYNVLLSIKKLCDDNNIVNSHYYLKPKRKNQIKTPARLSFNGFENTKKILEKIIPYSISKRKQFEMFLNEIYPIYNNRIDRGIHNNKMWNKKDWLKMFEIITNLNLLKGGIRGRNWSEFFKNKWK